MRRHKISTKILGVAVGIAISTLLVSGLVGFSLIRDAVETQAFEKLTAVREMKAQQIEDYFGFIRRQILTLSEDRMIIDATREFRAAFDSFEEGVGSSAQDPEADFSRLRDYYTDEFLPRLNANLDERAELSTFWPTGSAILALQDLYIASNPNPTGEKHLLSAADDDSDYSRAHQKYHPIIRDYLEKFG